MARTICRYCKAQRWCEPEDAAGEFDCEHVSGGNPILCPNVRWKASMAEMADENHPMTKAKATLRAVGLSDDELREWRGLNRGLQTELNELRLGDADEVNSVRQWAEQSNKRALALAFWAIDLINTVNGDQTLDEYNAFNAIARVMLKERIDDCLAEDWGDPE